MIDNDITPKLEKLGSERAAYLEYTTTSNELEGLNRFKQAHDYHCASKAKQKCVETQATDTARREELSRLMESTKGEVESIKKRIIDVMAKKEAEGSEQLKKLQSKEQARFRATTRCPCSWPRGATATRATRRRRHAAPRHARVSASLPIRPGARGPCERRSCLSSSSS